MVSLRKGKFNVQYLFSFRDFFCVPISSATWRLYYKSKKQTIRGLSFEGPERNQIKKEDMAELCQGQDKLDFVVFIS